MLQIVESASPAKILWGVFWLLLVLFFILVLFVGVGERSSPILPLILLLLIAIIVIVGLVASQAQIREERRQRS